jgi:hypothetical protein
MLGQDAADLCPDAKKVAQRGTWATPTSTLALAFSSPDACFFTFV